MAHETGTIILPHCP